MERFKCIMIILLFVVAAFACAANGKAAGSLLQEGLYAEEIDGDLDKAIKIYQQIIAAGTAQRSHIAQAMYRQGMCYLKKQDEAEARAVFTRIVTDYGDQTKIVAKVKPMLEELINGDPAALMPADTLLYIEIGSPGKQVETILKMLKGTPLENPLAAIGAGKNTGSDNAQPGPQNILAGLLNPSMLAEFKKIRGLGIGITGLGENEPAGVIVLYPGKSDALRGLLMMALTAFGTPGEAIEGMQTVAIRDGGGAAYDDSVVILASPKAYDAGQLTWCVKQYKGLISEPTLASSNKSFSKVSRKDRQENALTIWAKVDEVFAALKKVLPAGEMPDQIRMADEFVDLENVNDLIAFLSIEEDRIAVETNVSFKDGHRSVAYNLMRTSSLNKAAFNAVPSEAVALISVASPEPGSPQSLMLSGKLKDSIGLEIGNDVFANVDQITLFTLPAPDEAVPGVPPLALSTGLAVSSDQPQQTKQILTRLLTAANMLTSQPAEGENAGRYHMQLANGPTVHCYADKANKTTVLSLNPTVVDASVAALSERKSVTATGRLNEAVSTMSPETSKLALINVGGMLSFVEADEEVNELVAKLASSCDKTTVRFRTQEEQNNLNVRAEVSGLPPVGQVIEPAMQLAKLIQQAKEKAWAAKKEAGITASVRRASRLVVIDGAAEDLWSEVREYKIGNVIYSEPLSEDDFSGNFKAMWDKTNLYLLVDVTDDQLRNDSDPDQWWLDDCVEVFVDADNSKSRGYGDNDYLYFFEWDGANTSMGESKHGQTRDVEFAITRTQKGYQAEIKLPWSTLGTEPSAGTRIGLDVHINDDDDGGERESKLTWHGKEDDAWENPRALGTAELAGLVGWWKLDENSGSTVADSSGSGADGTIYNRAAGLGTDGSVWYTDPARGTVLSFNGDNNSGAYVRAGTVPAMTLANNFTWAFWARQDGDTGDQIHDIIVGNRFSDKHQFIKFTPTRFEYVNYDVRNDIDYDDIPAGIWLHHVLVKDGTNLTYYRDGVESGTSTVTTTIEANPFYFGGDVVKAGSNFAGERWRGYIDDVRIYNYALGKAEITALYSESK